MPGGRDELQGSGNSRGSLLRCDNKQWSVPEFRSTRPGSFRKCWKRVLEKWGKRKFSPTEGLTASWKFSAFESAALRVLGAIVKPSL